MFRLMGPNGIPSAQDVDRFVEFSAKEARDLEEASDSEDSQYCEALVHPNPAVRAAARRIVDAGGPQVYPEASKVPR
jgi:hypothetical protein